MDEALEPAGRTRRQSWISDVFDRTHGNYVVASLQIGLGLYAFGFVLAVSARFGRDYLESRLWALAAVIAWVFAWGKRSDRALFALPRDIEGAFRDLDGYGDLREKWYDRLYSLWSLWVGLCLAAALCVLAWVNEGIWTKRLPEEWSTQGHLTEAKLIVCMYFTVGAVLAVTMAKGFVDYFRFVFGVLPRKLTANLRVARASLRPITRFGLTTGVGWSIAVALTAVFFAPGSTPTTTAILLVIAVMGFALIFAPQALAHEALLRTRDELLVEAFRDVDAKEPEDWVTRFVRDENERAQRLRAFSVELDAVALWAPRETLSVAIQLAGTVAAVVGLLYAG